MIDRGKRNLLGVLVDAVDYEAAVARIMDAAREQRPFAVSALAVHGVMTGYTDKAHRARLNVLDLIVADGHPVRWALNWMYGTRLPDRVYGPTLTLKVCEAAAQQGLPVYFYGSRAETLQLLTRTLVERFPGLVIAGAEPSRFRTLVEDERAELVSRIKSSGARVMFVGLGCPRQEVWAYEYREQLAMPTLAVGAAFDFHAGTVDQAPRWMQDRGLEWLFRLTQEPVRLWRRYLILNPWYAFLVAQQLLRLRRFDPVTSIRPPTLSPG